MLEHAQHLLRAQRRAFLLFDAVLETIDLVLQRGVGLLQLGAIAEQREHAPVLGILRITEQHVDASGTPKLSQCLHGKSGRHRPSDS